MLLSKGAVEISSTFLFILFVLVQTVSCTSDLIQNCRDDEPRDVNGGSTAWEKFSSSSIQRCNSGSDPLVFVNYQPFTNGSAASILVEDSTFASQGIVFRDFTSGPSTIVLRRVKAPFLALLRMSLIKSIVIEDCMFEQGVDIKDKTNLNGTTLTIRRSYLGGGTGSKVALFLWFDTYQIRVFNLIIEHSTLFSAEHVLRIHGAKVSTTGVPAYWASGDFIIRNSTLHTTASRFYTYPSRHVSISGSAALDTTYSTPEANGARNLQMAMPGLKVVEGSYIRGTVSMKLWSGGNASVPAEVLVDQSSRISLGHWYLSCLSTSYICQLSPNSATFPRPTGALQLVLFSGKVNLRPEATAFDSAGNEYLANAGTSGSIQLHWCSLEELTISGGYREEGTVLIDGEIQFKGTTFQPGGKGINITKVERVEENIKAHYGLGGFIEFDDNSLMSNTNLIIDNCTLRHKWSIIAFQWKKRTWKGGVFSITNSFLYTYDPNQLVFTTTYRYKIGCCSSRTDINLLQDASLQITDNFIGGSIELRLHSPQPVFQSARRAQAQVILLEKDGDAHSPSFSSSIVELSRNHIGGNLDVYCASFDCSFLDPPSLGTGVNSFVGFRGSFLGMPSPNPATSTLIERNSSHQAQLSLSSWKPLPEYSRHLMARLVLDSCRFSIIHLERLDLSDPTTSVYLKANTLNHSTISLKSIRSPGGIHIHGPIVLYNTSFIVLESSFGLDLKHVFPNVNIGTRADYGIHVDSRHYPDGTYNMVGSWNRGLISIVNSSVGGRRGSISNRRQEGKSYSPTYFWCFFNRVDLIMLNTYLEDVPTNILHLSRTVLYLSYLQIGHSFDVFCGGINCRVAGPVVLNMTDSPHKSGTSLVKFHGFYDVDLALIPKDYHRNRTGSKGDVGEEVQTQHQISSVEIYYGSLKRLILRRMYISEEVEVFGCNISEAKLQIAGSTASTVRVMRNNHISQSDFRLCAVQSTLGARLVGGAEKAIQFETLTGTVLSGTGYVCLKDTVSKATRQLLYGTYYHRPSRTNKEYRFQQEGGLLLDNITCFEESSCTMNINLASASPCCWETNSNAPPPSNSYMAKAVGGTTQDPVSFCSNACPPVNAPSNTYYSDCSIEWADEQIEEMIDALDIKTDLPYWYGHLIEVFWESSVYDLIESIYPPQPPTGTPTFYSYSLSQTVEPTPSQTAAATGSHQRTLTKEETVNLAPTATLTRRGEDESSSSLSDDKHGSTTSNLLEHSQEEGQQMVTESSSSSAEGMPVVRKVGLSDDDILRGAGVDSEINKVVPKDAAISIAAVGTLSTVISAFGTPIAATQTARMGASLKVLNCILEDDERRPSYLEHPFQPSLGGGGRLEYFAGGVFMSTCLVIFFSILFPLALRRLLGAESRVYHVFTAIGLVMWAFFVPNISSTGATLIVHGTTGAESSVGAFGCAVSVASLVIVWVLLLPKFSATFDKDAKWRFADQKKRSSSEKNSFVLSFGPFFFDGKSARKIVRIYVAEDVTAATLMGVLAGFRPGSGNCVSVGIPLTVVALGHLVYTTAVRPFHTKMDTFFSILYACNQMLLAVMVLIALYEKDAVQVVVVCVMVQLISFLVQVVVQGSHEFYKSRQKEYNAHVAKVEAEQRGDDAGSDFDDSQEEMSATTGIPQLVVPNSLENCNFESHKRSSSNVRKGKRTVESSDGEDERTPGIKHLTQPLLNPLGAP